MGRKRNAGWSGGRIRYSTSGVPTYEVRRVVKHADGVTVRHEFSTGCSTLPGALDVLAKWERDHTFRPGNEAPPDRSPRRLELTEELCGAYLEYSARPKNKGGRENSRSWVRNQNQHLRWWRQALKGRDIRLPHTDVVTLKEALEGATCQQQRRAVLKALYSWLRSEKHIITTPEDPTYGQLKSIQSAPAQDTKSKAYDPKHFDILRAELEHADKYRKYADIFNFQQATRWHFTEIQRFARAGSDAIAFPDEEIIDEETGKVVLAIVSCPKSKGGAPIQVPLIEKKDVNCALRINARGAVGYNTYSRLLKVLCDALKIPRFMPGTGRHSGSTYAINQGASMHAVSTNLNHASERTTKRFYATHGVPSAVPTMTSRPMVEPKRVASAESILARIKNTTVSPDDLDPDA